MEPKLNNETNVTPVTVQRKKTEHAREVTHHLWSFALSILLTVFAFAAVGLELIENTVLLGMFILLLAAIQATFQMLIWMHMNQKGHEFPTMFILSGVFVAIITVAALWLLIWW
ncbi:cytochrome C oxidase subunit IV family protein [Caldalkalibacillus salinus]|uniref:cytochrome C oxidase subunit IV family protein n=1 Tax=Caldalkalibacillus salinus TaxID=2803787 RepID=UPI0019211005|nr:cytochrome C oxidase subunit IV family protein [Caldalkalibacillus salinus]